MAAINAAWAILRDPGAARVGQGACAKASPAAARPDADRPRDGDAARHAESAASSTRGGPTPVRRGHGRRRRGPHGEGAAGPPPGNPRGSVLDFGRHIGWSLGEIARVDPGYPQWLATHRDGGRYRAEIEAILGPMRARPEATAAARKRRRAIFR